MITIPLISSCRAARCEHGLCHCITRNSIGPKAEPSTALLLYTLLQTPGTLAHGILGQLDLAVRARLAVESWQAAQDSFNGISVEHIRYAARRVALEVCNDSVIDSRHLLLVCLVGSGLLGGGPKESCVCPPVVRAPRSLLAAVATVQDCNLES